MTQVERKVTLLSHTQLSEAFRDSFDKYGGNELDDLGITDGQALALTAIRTCYSPGKPSEIVAKEGKRYFKKKATDGGEGSDADRLIRMIVSSGHTSTLEGITFNFAVEGVSRACLAQLTRHRVGFSYSVQSQRYVKFGSDDKTGGFDYVMPPSLVGRIGSTFAFEKAMKEAQKRYDQLRKAGVPSEDARLVLPQAATCNLVMTANLRALLDFYSKRQKGCGAQWEIADLAERIREEVIKVEPWTERFFDET